MMKKILLWFGIWCILLWWIIYILANKVDNCVSQKEIINHNTKDYVLRDVMCTNIKWKVTIQSWEYIYIEWIASSFEPYWEDYEFKNWMHIAECYFEPIDINESLEYAKEWYEWIFNDEKYFACRQHPTAELQLIHRWKCEEFIDKWWYFECILKIDEYSSYPVFCM